MRSTVDHKIPSQRNFSPSLKYIHESSKDDFYSTSRAFVKGELPSSIISEEDRKLLKTERAGLAHSKGNSNFFYRLKLTETGHYILLMKFIEVSLPLLKTAHRDKGERVFHFKIGDELIFTLDIFAEAGYGKILHKWVEFDL